MIKQYFDYKRKQVEDLLMKPELTPQQRKNIVDEYNGWLKLSSKFDSHGRIIVSKAISDEIIHLVKERKIPLVIDKYDIGIELDIDMPNSDEYNGRAFQSIDDIVAVHKSPIPPISDTVVTQENSGLTNNIVFVDPSTGQQHSVPYIVGNDTIHFTLNCAVENHEVGNDWDNYKYAVIVDLIQLDKTKILDVKGEDTYIDGNAELGKEYYLFCPLGERQNVQSDNPNAIVIEYDGISLNEAIKCMIIYSGKKLEPYGTYGWGRNFEFSKKTQDDLLLSELLEKENYPNLQNERGSIMHSETKYMARRMWKREYKALLALLKYNQENNINMPNDIIMMVLMFGGAYSLPGTVPVSIESYKEYVLPILKEHGYEVGDELFVGIGPNESGIKYINKYPSPEYGRMLPVVQCPSWEVELRNRVIGSLQGKKVPQSDPEYLGQNKSGKK